MLEKSDPNNRGPVQDISYFIICLCVLEIVLYLRQLHMA